MTRRRRGDGTVYRRKDGRYEVQYYANTTSGIKRVSRYAPTRKAAEAILVDVRKKSDSGIKINTTEEKLGVYMDYYLMVVKTSIRRTTWYSYESLIRIYLKPALGNKYLTKLGVADTQTFINNQLRAGQSCRNVQKMRNVLSAVLSLAVYEERLVRNVAREVRLPMYKPKSVEPWTVDQLTSFWNYAGDHHYYPIYFLMGFYGLRRGEALGISWSDLDFDKKVIRIQKQVEYFEGSYNFVELKTEKSQRVLPIPENSMAVLKNLKPTSKGPLPDLIFKTSSGLPIDPNNLRRTFKRMSKEIGLPIITLHDLRHTAATNLKDLDVPAKDVQSILGHSHISTTLQIYTHSDMTSKSEALQKYGNQISEKTASSRQVKPSDQKFLAEYIKINSSNKRFNNATHLRLMSPVL